MTLDQLREMYNEAVETIRYLELCISVERQQSDEWECAYQQVADMLYGRNCAYGRGAWPRPYQEASMTRSLANGRQQMRAVQRQIEWAVTQYPKDLENHSHN